MIEILGKKQLRIKTSLLVEAPILWPPDAKNWLIRKDPDAGKDWEQEKKGATEDEMVGWHNQLNAHEFEQTQEIAKDREAWRGVLQFMRSQSQTQLSDWKTTNYLESRDVEHREPRIAA